jgi:hypothetical protein
LQPLLFLVIPGDRTPRLAEGSIGSVGSIGSTDGPVASEPEARHRSGPTLTEACAGPTGKAVVVAALLATGVDKPLIDVEVDTRRQATPASHRPLLDLDDIFGAALADLRAPQSITHPRASLAQLVNLPNANGITPLHVAFGGNFGEWAVGGGGKAKVVKKRGLLVRFAGGCVITCRHVL